MISLALVVKRTTSPLEGFEALAGGCDRLANSARTG